MSALTDSERLDLVVRVASLLIENGAPTYRTEETIRELAAALELPALDLMVLPTGFMLDSGTAALPLSRVRRVTRMGVDMNCLTELNTLARQASGLSHGVIAERVAAIEARPGLYPAWAVVLGVAISCAAFGALLGAGWREILAGFIGSAVAIVIRRRMTDPRLLAVVIVVTCSFFATASSRLSCLALGCPEPDLASIAAVLQFVPGVPLVTAVIDLASGDLLSGLARGAYGVLMAAAIAVGILLFIGWGMVY